MGRGKLSGEKEGEEELGFAGAAGGEVGLVSGFERESGGKWVPFTCDFGNVARGDAAD